jgi:hypothetical protein
MPKKWSIVTLTLALAALLLAAAFAFPGAKPVAADYAAQAASQPAAPSGILDIPSGKIPHEIDGVCGTDEYLEAVEVTFLDGDGKPATVKLVHDGDYLYVCMQAQPGTYDARFGRVYLDPQGDGASYVYARQDDRAFQVDVLNSARSSYRGSDVPNGWVADPASDSFWDGKATFDAQGETVEYRLSMGRLGFGECESLFGLAVYHHWFSAVGDDYGYPSNQWFDQPRTWSLARLLGAPCVPPASGKIAYVFRGREVDAASFYNLLTANGYTVTLVPLGDILTTDFSQFDLILIADDSGSLDQWGSTGLTASQVAQIQVANKPIIGIGEGGYAYFGQVPRFIGWPNGWHGPDDDLAKAATAPPAYFTSVPGDPVTLYSQPVNTVAIYLGIPVPADAFAIGLETPDTQHANLIQQGCNLLWGFSGNPLGMTSDGSTVFLNAVGYMKTYQCSTPPPPGPCLSIEKTASPPDGATVMPGDIISYTISYVISDDPACENPKEGRLVDFVPEGTHFVPGSASDGISPQPDGALIWTVHPAAGTQTKTFQVLVGDTACVPGRAPQIMNSARLDVGTYAPLDSNTVTHDVECPPVQLPNDQPWFAEEEVQVYPYPLVTGSPSTIQVRIVNTSPTAQTVNVAFQTSPDRFGIGLSYNTFATDVITIPAGGSAIAQAVFTPVSSGHYCIQIVITGAGLNTPLVTQRNIDVTEDLQGGMADDLTFQVGNPTAAIADVTLVVDNTCPGWQAEIVDPAGGVLTDMAPGEVRSATWRVTPPDPVVLGSACHIDVQGWIGGRLIGGIRKLDVPPVHLPTDVNPPWAEQEISTIPNPAVKGQPARYCIELQNPLPVTRTVTVEYQEADFGAGIGFTPVATQVLDLPPNSLDKYCIDWTPSATGTLHRCLRVKLSQPGYQDQYSQHNIDLVRILPIDLSKLKVPFVVRNPDLVPHKLGFKFQVFGVDPAWQPEVMGDGSVMPPEMLGAGEQVNLEMILIGLKATQDMPVAPGDYRYGDQSQIEVEVLLDDVPLGGFTVVLETPSLYLPLVEKNQASIEISR